MKLETVMRMYLDGDTEKEDVERYKKNEKWTLVSRKVEAGHLIYVFEHKFMTQDEKWEQIRNKVEQGDKQL